MTTYVLVPGAGGSAWFWHLLTPHLKAKGHDVVTVGLPAADEDAGLDVYAQTIVTAVGQSASDVSAAGRRGDLVVVAMSMGGFSAPLVCDRLPVTSLVLVNAMIPAPGETAGAWWANTGQERARRESDIAAGRDPDADFDPVTYFFHDVPAPITTAALEIEEAQAGKPFGEPWPLPAWPDVPTRVLTGRDDRIFPVAFQTRIAEERLGITPELLPGGHLLALSHPARLAELL
ncbi:alpha/beta fold hydrolase [Winogradskya humida]|uniref:Alpha/beta hydrolase n=1 Tax=Winogradskya humida TaxID=113566 RepID=A0ABQ4A0K4_9ACTN|nr:alpha/beta hydrolase [Actinoplanes humidus]GIE24249.1 alpha/beta hydrolase [Actinoplanes humidus]